MAAPWSSSTKSLDQQAATNQTRKNSENSLSLHLTRLFQATVMLPFLNFGAIDFRTDRNTLGTENIMFQIRPHPRSPNRSEPSNPPKSTIQIIELIWHSQLYHFNLVCMGLSQSSTGDDTCFAGGFHQLEKLSFLLFSASVSTAFYSSLPIQNPPPHSVFYSLLLSHPACHPPVQSLLLSPCNMSFSSFYSGLKTTLLILVFILFAFTFPLRLFSCSLNSSQTRSYFSYHLDGKRRNTAALFLQHSCAITSFQLWQPQDRVCSVLN